MATMVARPFQASQGKARSPSIDYPAFSACQDRPTAKATVEPTGAAAKRIAAPARAGRHFRAMALDALLQPPDNYGVLEAEIRGPRVSAGVGQGVARVRLGLCVALTVGLVAPAAQAEPSGAPLPAVPATAAGAASEPVPLFAYVVGALGLSGISVAATTGFLAMNQRSIAEDHCSATVRLCDATGTAANETGRTLRDISTAGWIVGGLGVGLSAYLLLTAPSRPYQVSLALGVDGARPQAALVAHF